MSKRKQVSTGAEWEEIVGYTRAVKIGNIIEVSGTTAIQDRQIIGVDDPYKQAKFIINIIKETLEKLDAGLHDVVRTRMYVTDITHWEQVGKAHGEFFAEIKPASTLIEVKGLVHPDMLVEIEATAVLPE